MLPLVPAMLGTLAIALVALLVGYRAGRTESTELGNKTTRTAAKRGTEASR